MYESWSSCYLNCLILSPVTHRRHCGHFKKWIKPFLWKCRCQKFTPCNDNVQFCILHFTQILNIPFSSLIVIKTLPCSFIKTRPFFFHSSEHFRFTFIKHSFWQSYLVHLSGERTGKSQRSRSTCFNTSSLFSGKRNV